MKRARIDELASVELAKARKQLARAALQRQRAEKRNARAFGRWEAEVAALKSDAERYRWLRDFPMRKNLPEGAPWWSVSVEQGGVGYCYRGSKLDAAIDEARKER